MALPQAGLDAMSEKDIEPMKEWLKLLASQMPDLMLSAFGPAIDVATNTNYLGIPIESAGMQYQYHTERKYDYTSKLGGVTSKALDKFGVKVSPIQLDYMFTSYTGGVFNQFKRKGEGLEGLPVLSDLLVHTPEKPRRQLNQFFDDYEVLGQKVNSGIATEEEKRKFNKLKGFRDVYTVYNK